MWNDNDLVKLPRGPGGSDAATSIPIRAAPVLARLYARLRERKQEATA